MPVIEIERFLHVFTLSYGPDDQYEAVDLGKIQVVHENFKHGDKVKVTIRIEKEEVKENANL